jgi:hypothetical protein
VVTLDNVIVSGHRRFCACRLAGLEEISVRRIDLLSTDLRFEDYLVSFNRQRVKTAAEVVREEVVRTRPDAAHNTLLAHREVERAKAYRRVQDASLRVLDPAAAAARPAISDAKRPMLNAAVAVLNQYRHYWPLTSARCTTGCWAVTSSATRTSPGPSTRTRSRVTRTCRTC